MCPNKAAMGLSSRLFRTRNRVTSQMFPGWARISLVSLPGGRSSMRMKVLGALVVFLLCVGVVAAEEVKGKIKSLNGGTGKNDLTVNGKDQGYLLSRATKFLDENGKDLKDGIDSKDLAAGAEVTLSYDKKGARLRPPKRSNSARNDPG